MTNRSLAQSYLQKCELRLVLLRVAADHAGWSDVVREAQECVELALKAMLRAVGTDPPKVHDVGHALIAAKAKFPPEVDLAPLVEMSRELRKDREFAMYGSDDLPPTEAYTEAQARQAIAWSEQAVAVAKHVCAVAFAPPQR